MNCLNRLEFSLPFLSFFFPQPFTSNRSNSSNSRQLSGHSSSELPTLPSDSSVGNPCLFSNLSELPILSSSSASATQNQNQTTHLNEELINLDMNQISDTLNQHQVNSTGTENIHVLDKSSSSLLRNLHSHNLDNNNHLSLLHTQLSNIRNLKEILGQKLPA
ncbi:hypothetical protein PSTT_14770 [Puccinia striiformis]|uniref:Uncharacterized protein n=1 Tax=Puccinia striiformis TaxID=27350 RepID=A0A2S4UL25_9BASI|nr:hypothetical protein PSTT_14770 [Puccinia striiformis]